MLRYFASLLVAFCLLIPKISHAEVPPWEGVLAPVSNGAHVLEQAYLSCKLLNFRFGDASAIQDNSERLSGIVARRQNAILFATTSPDTNSSNLLWIQVLGRRRDNGNYILIGEYSYLPRSLTGAYIAFLQAVEFTPGQTTSTARVRFLSRPFPNQAYWGLDALVRPEDVRCNEFVPQ